MGNPHPLTQIVPLLHCQVGESYERAYTDMVRVQQLTELEEVIAYKQAAAAAVRQQALHPPGEHARRFCVQGGCVRGCAGLSGQA